MMVLFFLLLSFCMTGRGGLLMTDRYKDSSKMLDECSM